MKPDGRSESESKLATRRRRLRHWLGALGAVLVVILLNGCASIGAYGDAGPWQYNPNTGYPAVGGPFSWGRI